ncbi:MAG: type I-B CRISPR-associated protein Cas7/Cst2/DevR [Candidatus Methanomethylicia archaeon]
MPSRALISLILKVSGNVNADIGIGTRVPIKKIITWNQEVKPFVSARCIRRAIREKFYEKGFSIDPLNMIELPEKKQLSDMGNPVEFVDDDLFGFLLPEKTPLRRSSPIKISHLISLRHAEIKVEFAARFPRDFLPEYKHGFPVPFEIELAEWLGKLNVIISDRIGRFSDDELKEDLKEKLGESRSLSNDERIKRLKGFLEILLWEGWNFPRGSQSPSVPEFYYSIIGLTKRFVPLFGYVDITDEGKLNEGLIENLKNMYDRLLDKLFILDYKGARYISYTFKSSEGKKEEKVLNSESISMIIKDICDYIIY